MNRFVLGIWSKSSSRFSLNIQGPVYRSFVARSKSLTDRGVGDGAEAPYPAIPRLVNYYLGLGGLEPFQYNESYF